jgi:L-ascorbate metabolism protein UlaG (beta-lactamase superfamily)
MRLLTLKGCGIIKTHNKTEVAGKEAGLLKSRWPGKVVFRVCPEQAVTLLDFYFSRDIQTRPVLTLYPVEVTRADFVFPSHSHLDHSEVAS